MQQAVNLPYVYDSLRYEQRWYSLIFLWHKVAVELVLGKRPTRNIPSTWKVLWYRPKGRFSTPRKSRSSVSPVPTVLRCTVGWVRRLKETHDDEMRCSVLETARCECNDSCSAWPIIVAPKSANRITEKMIRMKIHKEPFSKMSLV